MTTITGQPISLRSIYQHAAQQWQESAVYWRGVAEKALRGDDFNRAAFAHTRVQDCERWAEEDAKKAEAYA